MECFPGTELLLKGLKALRMLTRDTKELGVLGKIRVYEKKGDFRDAWADFYSVKPANIEEFYTPLGVYMIKISINIYTLFA